MPIHPEGRYEGTIVEAEPGVSRQGRAYIRLKIQLDDSAYLFGSINAYNGHRLLSAVRDEIRTGSYSTDEYATALLNKRVTFEIRHVTLDAGTPDERTLHATEKFTLAMTDTPRPKQYRGFAAMSPERRREISIKGANTPRRRGRRPASLFDPDTFATLIRTRLAELNISKRRAAALLEISPATFNRISNGGTPDIETYLRVSRWLGENAHQLPPSQSSPAKPSGWRPIERLKSWQGGMETEGPNAGEFTASMVFANYADCVSFIQFCASFPLPPERKEQGHSE